MITEKELKLIRHQKGGGKNYHRKKRMLDKKHKEREDKIYEFGQFKKRDKTNLCSCKQFQYDRDFHANDWPFREAFSK